MWGSYIWFAVAHLVHDLTVHHLLGHLNVVLRVATIPCQPSPLCQALKLRNVKEWRKQKRITHWPVEKPPKKKFVPLPTYAFPALFALKLVLHIHSWTSISRCSSFAQNHRKSRNKILSNVFLFFVLYLQSLWSQNKQPVLAPCLREWWCGGRLEKEAANLFTKSFPSFLFLQHWYFHHLSVKSDKRLDSGKETLYQ